MLREIYEVIYMKKCISIINKVSNTGFAISLVIDFLSTDSLTIIETVKFFFFVMKIKRFLATNI